MHAVDAENKKPHGPVGTLGLKTVVVGVEGGGAVAIGG